MKKKYIYIYIIKVAHVIINFSKPIECAPRINSNVNYGHA